MVKRDRKTQPVVKRQKRNSADELLHEIEGDKAPSHAILKTGIDRLYELVQAKKRVKLSTASRRLRVKERTVMDWARILEKNNLVTLHYPLIGDMEVCRR